MKKLLSGLLLTTALALGTKAQVYVQGGLNLANITTTNDGQTQKDYTLPTFNIGLLGRFGLSSTLDLESGFLLTGHGSKAESYFNGGNDYVKSTFNPFYIEVPLNVVVKIPLEKGTNIFFNGGPYIAIGVAGKSKSESKIGPIVSSSTSNIQFSNDSPFTSQQNDDNYNKLKRFDFGLNIGGGLELQHLLLKANYGYGLTKINATQTNNTVNDKNKYRTFSFSVGIPFGK